MFLVYPAIYRDMRGEERVEISNDNKSLRMTVRGVEFLAHSFDAFEPSMSYDMSLLEHFDFASKWLCSFMLDCDIPILVIDNSSSVEAVLHIHVEIGEPVNKQNESTGESGVFSDKDILQLELSYSNQSIKSGGQNRYTTFDEQLIDIKMQLPDNVYIKTCWNCAFSDYSPVGSGSFGDLACFRNTKEEYHNVKNKHDLFQVWDKRAENVQEIYLCPEFEKRQPGIGGLYVG